MDLLYRAAGISDLNGKANFAENETAVRIVERDYTIGETEKEVYLETIDHTLRGRQATLIKWI